MDSYWNDGINDPWDYDPAREEWPRLREAVTPGCITCSSPDHVICGPQPRLLRAPDGRVWELGRGPTGQGPLGWRTAGDEWVYPLAEVQECGGEPVEDA